MKDADGPFEALALTLREDTAPMALAPEPHQLLLATADPALATRLRRLLELIGHRVDSCPSGRETLRRWRAGGVARREVPGGRRNDLVTLDAATVAGDLDAMAGKA